MAGCIEMKMRLNIGAAGARLQPAGVPDVAAMAARRASLGANRRGNLGQR